MKKYYTSIYRDNCLDWTPANAIREIVQNCLDSPAPFEYLFDGSYLEFTSKGVSLEPRTLLIGVSGKRNDPDSVGGKGEGFKIASAILLREGYSVVIRNGSLIWTPSFEFHEDFQEEVLVFTETQGSGSDLTFEVSGVSSDLVSEVEHDCLYLQSDLGEILEGQCGRILTERPNKLYVGGLFVCDLDGRHQYGYDFKPQYLKLNRDRKSVDNWNLAENTSKLIQEVKSAKEVAKMVKQSVYDVSNYYVRPQGKEVAEECYNIFQAENKPLTIVAKDSYDKTKLEERGFKNVEVVYNQQYLALIQESESYQNLVSELESTIEVVEEDTRTPLEMLEEWYNEADLVDHLFEDLLELFSKRGLQFKN